jgi:hypothetical protein
MTVVEKIYWAISVVCIVALVFGGVSSVVIMFVLGFNMVICCLVIEIIADSYQLLYDLNGHRDKMAFPVVDLERVLNEIEAGNIVVTPKRWKYLQALHRMHTYGIIPIVISFIWSL